MLSEFDKLPAEEQHNFLIQILRRTGNLPDGALEDDDLTLIADQLFQALDKGEAHFV
jgi:hypothetical protein